MIGFRWNMQAYVLAGMLFCLAGRAHAYPPAVGILAQHRSCLSCHVNNGPWSDEERTVVDILDAHTKRSLRREDGSFLIAVRRGESRTVLTVIGRTGDEKTPPLRNGWLYVDPSRIETRSLSKFAPGWDVNLPASCRIVGDEVAGYPGAHVTALPMTVRPLDAAADARLELQAMLTGGASVKGEAVGGLISNYLERTVHFRVED